MGKANSLSRRLDWEVRVERDNKNKILVKLEQLEVRRIKGVEVIEHGGQWKTVELVTRNFWWPGVTREVK